MGDGRTFVIPLSSVWYLAVTRALDPLLESRYTCAQVGPAEECGLRPAPPDS